MVESDDKKCEQDIKNKEEQKYQGNDKKVGSSKRRYRDEEN